MSPRRAARAVSLDRKSREVASEDHVCRHPHDSLRSSRSDRRWCSATGEPVARHAAPRRQQVNVSTGPGAEESHVRDRDDRGRHHQAKVSGDEANGTKLNFEYTAIFDGKDYPVTGNSDVDATSFRRIDARTLESLRKKGGKLVSTMRFVVSSDGKVVTLTETMADKKPGDVLVFER